MLRPLAASKRRLANWLVAEMSVTNDGTTPHVFSLEDVEARYSVANGWEAVSAHLVGPVRDRVGPGDTHNRDVLFSLPETASVYTVVVRRALEAQKNTDSAVEFDLNCC